MNRNSKITIFTPTFNRSYTLEKLYKSLTNQTYKEFEWVVVDDGSTDDTERLMQCFIEKQDILIRYIKQKNGGKHRAINRGLKEAEGELFFIVDSDDYLPPNSLEYVIMYYDKIKNDKSIAGVVGLKCYENNTVVGTTRDIESIICNSFDYRFKFNIKGDRAEIIKTSIFREFPFPEFKGENFVAESIVWNKIASQYKLLYFNKNIYICEYLLDGLSKKSAQLRKSNPIGATTLYSELASYNIPISQKLKASINYWRYAIYNNKSNLRTKINKIGLLWTIIAFPLAMLKIFVDKNQ